MGAEQPEGQHAIPMGYVHLENDPAICAKDLLRRELMEALIENRSNFLGYLQKRMNDRDEAEDVLQDFYLRAISKVEQIRSARSILPWSYSVLKSVLSDHFRRKMAAKRVQQELSDEQSAENHVQIQSANRADCRCFYSLLPGLKAEYATVLARVDLAGESHEEAARSLGITAANLRVRLHRARQALKKSLRTSCEECRLNECFDHETSGHRH